jgi:hypothetical protein
MFRWRSRTRYLRVPYRRDLGWLGLSLVVAGLVALTYYATHTHPAYEGGLFLQIVEEVRTGGYALPARIPYYTEGGVPFAYPPLVFFAVAAVVDLTGIDPLTVMLFLPALATMATVVPFYAVAAELLPSRRQAGLATVFFATTPAVLRWHISAGGLVRAPAALLALTGVYAGVRLFARGDRWWVLPATVLFGLTLLSHPHYAAFFGVSHLVLYAAYDRSVEGVAIGAVVAGGGILLAAPWWGSVVVRHGPETILGATGSHKGLGGGLHRLHVHFRRPLLRGDLETPYYALAFLGSLFLIARRRFLLPAWLFVVTYVVGKDRFLFVPGAMAMTVAVFAAVRALRSSDRDLLERVPLDRVPLDRDALAGTPRGWSPLRERAVERVDAGRVLVATLVVATAAVGAAFAGGFLATEHHHSHSQPQTVDDADRAAMDWVRDGTSADASFVVLGDAAEWFPHETERSGLVGPWGLEWTGARQYYREVRLFVRASTCPDALCLAGALDAGDRAPDFVYVPKGTFTVRGREYEQTSWMRRSLVGSDRFEIAYENRGVLIAAVEGSGRVARSGQSAPDREHGRAPPGPIAGRSASADRTGSLRSGASTRV